MIVKIDIKPEGPENKLNPTSRGKIKVAILSSSSFNAPAQVDMNSLTFGHAGDEKSLAFCNIHREDHDHDNRPDLICYFDTPTANFQKGDTVGILKGRLLNGNPIQGSDSVHLVH